MLFVDKLGYIILGFLTKNITFVLEKVAKTVLQWDRTNIVTYSTTLIATKKTTTKN